MIDLGSYITYAFATEDISVPVVDTLLVSEPVPGGAVTGITPARKMKLLPDPTPAKGLCDGVKSPRTGSPDALPCPDTGDWCNCAVDEMNVLGVETVLTDEFGVATALANGFGVDAVLANGLGDDAGLST